LGASSAAYGTLPGPRSPAVELTASEGRCCSLRIHGCLHRRQWRTRSRTSWLSAAVEELGLVIVVGPTTKLHRLYVGLATHPIRFQVVELGKGPLVTTATPLADEGATPAIADPDRAPDLRRDVPGAGGRTAAGSRPVGRGELLSGQFLEQHG